MNFKHFLPIMRHTLARFFVASGSATHIRILPQASINNLRNSLFNALGARKKVQENQSPPCALCIPSSRIFRQIDALPLFS